MLKFRTFAAPAHQHLDQATLHRVRATRGFSSRQVALESGIPANVYARLETGENPDLSTVSVAALVRVADHLRVPVGDLFTDPNTPQPLTETDPATDPVADVRTLGALLAAVETQAPLVALADSLGWTQERLHAALAGLDDALAPAGLMAFRQSGRVQIRPRSESHRDAERRFREHPRATPSQRLVNAYRAALLHRAMQRPIRALHCSRRDLHEIAILLNAGLLIENAKGDYIPHPDVDTSLYPQGHNHPEGAIA